MPQQYDFKKEWEKTKKQLIQFSKEASDIAKKGEHELVRLTRQGKVHVDTTTIGLKKEQLYYKIGKEFVKLTDASNPTANLKKLVAEYKALDKKQKSLKRKIKKKQ